MPIGARSAFCIARHPIVIASRMGEAPTPGVGHHLLQARMARRPAKLAPRTSGRRDEHGRVPGPTLECTCGDGASGHLARRLDHLADAEARGRAEVVDLQARISLAGRLEREQVSVPYVSNV